MCNEREKPYGIIYQATFRADGRRYIGQTTRALNARKRSHDSAARSGRKMYLCNMIRKYGVDAFDWEAIDTAFSEKELNEKERAYICQYRSNQKEFGFNLTDGGDTTKFSPEAIQKRIDSFKKNRAEGKHPPRRPRRTTREGTQRVIDALATPIICVETGVIYPSVKAAAKATNQTQGNISAVLRGKRHIAKGFTFDFVRAEDAIGLDMDLIRRQRRKYAQSPHFVIPSAKAVRCIETGETFPSAMAAGKYYGIDDSYVAKAARRGLLCHGLHWEYMKSE